MRSRVYGPNALCSCFERPSESCLLTLMRNDRPRIKAAKSLRVLDRQPLLPSSGATNPRLTMKNTSAEKKTLKRSVLQVASSRHARGGVIKSNEIFGEAYYQRFYQNEKTRVQSASEIAPLLSAVVGLCRWYGVPLRNAIDVGAGTGLWRDWFRRNEPNVLYRSVEYSAYACRVFGHERGDLVSIDTARSYDLVVCQGVLPYVQDADLPKAVENLAKLCRGFLYLEAITSRDAAEVCDRSLTDLAVNLRAKAVYEKLLARHFVKLGAGLFIARRAEVPLYDLECADIEALPAPIRFEPDARVFEDGQAKRGATLARSPDPRKQTELGVSLGGKAQVKSKAKAKSKSQRLA
jgi:hypothetical protein